MLPLVIALGDSMTSGFGLPSPSTQNYAAVYARAHHARLVNLAIPGSQCEDVLDNQIAQMPSGASIVILNCGTNDIGGFGFTPEGKPDGSKRPAAANDAELRAAEVQLHRAIAAIRRREPAATIYLVNLRHAQRVTGPEASQYARDVTAWNEMLAATGLPLIRISDDARMDDRRFVQPDLVHLNAAGQAAVASDFPR